MTQIAHWLGRGNQRKDLVLLGAVRSRVVVVRVIEDYIFEDTNRILNDNYFHLRRVEFTILDPEKVWRDAGGTPAKGEDIY